MTFLKKGDTAPQFTLPDEQNQMVALNSFKGQLVVIYFYPKDDTSGCTMEAINFSTLSPEFTKHNIKIIGISPDSVESHQKFCNKHDLSLCLLSDTTHSTLEAYGVWVEKTMYGKKYMGVERTSFLIDKDGTIAFVWPKVKVPNHAEEVLEEAKNMNSSSS